MASSTVKTETLLQRWDALLVGSVLAGAIVYAVKQWDVAINVSQATSPLIHTYTWSLPSVAVGLYLLLIFVIRPVFFPMSDKKPVAGATAAATATPKKKGFSFMDYVLQGWNFFLAFLSLCMVIGLGWEMLAHLLEHGPVEFVCDSQLSRWQGPLYFWMIIFKFSKFAELFDTVLLVVRRRPVTLLHGWHHTSVLVYVWAACLARFSVGWIFGFVNCVVHAIMYWYYYRAARGVRLTYSKFITTIQLSQMVLGLFFTALWSYLHYFTETPCPCDYPDSAVGGAVVMYASYFVLFLQFFINRYYKNAGARKAVQKKVD